MSAPHPIDLTGWNSKEVAYQFCGPGNRQRWLRVSLFGRQNVHAVDLCGCDQRSVKSPCAPALVVSGEDRAFPGQRDPADQALDGIGIELDAAVLKEGQQFAPTATDVGQFFAQPRFAVDMQALCLNQSPYSAASRAVRFRRPERRWPIPRCG